LPLSCIWQLWRLDWIQFLFPSSYPGGLASRNSTRLCCWTPHYNHSARTTQRTASLVKEACLLIRCLAVDVLFCASFCGNLFTASQYSCCDWCTRWRSSVALSTVARGFSLSHRVQTGLEPGVRPVHRHAGLFTLAWCSLSVNVAG
jgi:hypothetical protein